MRDITVLLAVAAICIAALRHPWIGVMGWTWLSIMNPHRLTWGFAYTMPFAAAVAIATMAGLVLTRDRRIQPFTRTSTALALFLVWMCVAWPFSVDPAASVNMLTRVLKIELMVFVAIMLLDDRKKIHWYIWVIALSLGFYGVKGGLFTLATGGAYRVWGPGGSFIEGNNEIALALIIVIPLLRFLQLQSQRKAIRWGLTAAMLLCCFAALGSHSRGALLAIAAMGVFFWWRSRQKLILLPALVAVAAAAVAFMPQDWEDRMSTIAEYQEDDSARGRLIAWETAWNVAKDRPFGAGFAMYTPAVSNIYSPNPERIHAAHSIYFQVLGELGFIGLALFILMWFLAWRDAAAIRAAATDGSPDALWRHDLASMCQVSLVGYAVGGAFLSLAYFDLPYCILVALVCARRLTQTEAQSGPDALLAGHGRRVNPAADALQRP
jgi:probable O-glycosylation ligase (exosortase A-associated)